jgi:hypothetical protein
MPVRSFALLLALAGSAPAADDDGFTPLFNGKDLTGWAGRTDLWGVKDGAITGTTTKENPLKQNTFLVWQGGKPGDFEVRFEYKIQGGNSGFQYRSKVTDEAAFVVGGYQADIDSKPVYTGINYEERGRGILAKRGEKVTVGSDGKKAVEAFADPAELQKKVKAGEWNDYRVVARGNSLKHTINGELMSEVIDNQADKAATSGVLAFQVHVGEPMVVQFKNVRIKEAK